MCMLPGLCYSSLSFIPIILYGLHRVVGSYSGPSTNSEREASE
jgi:hypothetical protein